MSSNNFDFNAFNTLTAQKPAGLQLYLAIQLLNNALWTMDRFDNPRADDMRGLLGELKVLRGNMKKDAEERSKNDYARKIDEGK